ncbi:hypothetical protein GQ55_3G103900 [Panicum hallii var. hallii]|uniref:Uncharacterized protein n=1 Tax=Panicum hallii var. hallii TaxID=1504633 RepID=A0A2T7E7W0_9POAL|nr:hypothetical protein GQ55_3G103900 [Panicum hallii var. hallii]
MSFLRPRVWQRVTCVIILLPPSCKHQDSCTPTIFDSFYRLQDDLFIGGVSYISTRNTFLATKYKQHRCSFQLCHVPHF